MSYGNQIVQRRPGSTFDAFEVYHQGQQDIVDTMTELADQIIGSANTIVNDEYPFPFGQIIFLWSEVGQGKTHLLEAFVNRVLKQAPELEKRIYLSRSNFCHDNMTAAARYDNLPIILIDDLFSDLQSVDAMHPATDLKALMHFFTRCYDRRPLVICTSNFSMNEGQGLLSRLGQADKIGRALSRAKELLSTAGEIYLPGKDFRGEIAKRRQQSFKKGRQGAGLVLPKLLGS